MAGMGLVFPYQSLYLSENAALAGTQLGLVLAIRPLVGILAQPFWGQVADRSGSRSRVLAAVTLGTALAYALFPLAHFRQSGSAANGLFFTALSRGWQDTDYPLQGPKPISFADGHRSSRCSRHR